jgi:uncharacterized protein YacL (UPF0231 family)
MNWLKQKLRNWLNSDELIKMSANKAVTSRESLRSSGMNFTIYQANGGTIVEINQYDHKTDRNDHNLHIITNDQDLGQGIAHIVTFEMLKR